MLVQHPTSLPTLGHSWVFCMLTSKSPLPSSLSIAAAEDPLCHSLLQLHMLEVVVLEDPHPTSMQQDIVAKTCSAATHVYLREGVAHSFKKQMILKKIECKNTACIVACVYIEIPCSIIYNHKKNIVMCAPIRSLYIHIAHYVLGMQCWMQDL